MGRETVRITEAMQAAIIRHALRARPQECCGLLSGTGDLIGDAHPLGNEADQPEVRYFASPKELFTAMRRIRESGQEMLGIYHSHPRSPAYPSASDVEMAFYPDAVYFIISLEPGVEVRAFRIADAQIREVEIEISQEG